MTKPSILITARFDPAIADQLHARADISLHDWAKSGRYKETGELASALKGKRILVTEIDQVNDALLAAAPDVRIVITCRGNPVNLDIPACTRRGVLALNTPGRNAEAVADLTIAYILACARHVVTSANYVAQGGWTSHQQQIQGQSVFFRFHGVDMDTATVGLVGLGAVGRGVAKRLQGFGTRVLAVDPYIKPEVAKQASVTLVDLPTLLRESDFVSMHVHVTKETKGMIGAAQFALMKPTAYLINTARSGAVDQDAMVAALREKRIAGAALDVFDTEPLAADSPIRKLDNVIITPHVGGATPGIIKVQSRVVAGQLAAILDGREPPHMLNPEVAKAALRAR
ncbi:MAG: hypothetical protein HY261_00945 [Chloroflexi bacterium]|nr:hypothetical protein [Chloroflexota bacterium]